ncbi:DUF1553 domain-containing protein [Limnoglobus roseus]|uniref:LamG-like jellyroll fold domain-containing protein n=1 Tax=Limnoglobus roseus TaxID=2598579 RepID=A0A5C1ACN7_9BACT|nr:DUF1553 domain-containing protein [Limnoglobus roseus]QEL16510.1 hypothetical protein PX52LOC_03469 [Limnoglobus roseus]
MPRFLPLVVLGWLLLPTAGAAAEVDFARDVLPILSEKCFFCHGPDEAARKAGLRLDTKDGAFRKKKDRTMIVPGKSAESEVISRIVSKDADEQMPPPDSNRTLTPRQIETLKKWVDEGATWGQHWAYVPLPRAVVVPEVQSSKFKVQRSIDNFILSRLEKEGLSPSPSATKAAWLRRVSLDLTGLPPSVAELDAFEKDTSPSAYETVVDRLLASPRYGERMASDWLDVARYADTHGYQSDRFRNMWAYRDWVIKAFNANQKFDQFTIDQLAGDLRPNATKDQRLATAFNRLHMQNEEGGIVEEEFRVAYVVDRVTTFGTAFLAQTLECCRCHDHKYDPLAQKDFYQLFAFFQNIDESGQTSYFTSSMPVPALPLTTDEQDRKIAELRKIVRAKEAEVKTAREKAHDAFAAWPRPKEITPSGLVAHFPFDELSGNKSPNAIDAKQTANGHEGPKLVAGKVGQAVELSGESGFDIPGVGHFSRSDPFSISLWLKSSKHEPRAVVLHHSRAPIDAGSRGYELLLENGKVAFGLHHMWPGNSLKVATSTAIRVNEWTHVTVCYDGSSRADGLHVYVNGQLAACDVVRDGLRRDITYEGGEPSLQVGYRFRDNGFKGGAVDDLRIFNRALTPLEVGRAAGTNANDGEAAWEEFFASTADEPTMRAKAALREARLAHAKFVNAIPEAMVMQEMPAPKPARLLKRGAYDAPGDPVATDTPKTLPPFAADLPRNRFGLATWLTQPDHPLFARVTVNRLWQQMFGTGLVETSDNFGTTGVPPTHPELLDWLARDFSTDWDVKRTLKQMALSATYRQSSKATPELLQRDPYNHLLARFPARRLSAEMLRDQALFVSGLLNEKQGGPSVYPYQPEGLWNEAMGRPHYPQSKGGDLYRRSLYTVWKRTAPHPQMTTFDAADRSNCSARRQTTSTPLQALALLNDPQFVEAARFLGQRMLKDGGPTPTEQVAWAFRTVTGRSASEKELTVLVKLYEEQQAEFARDAKAAENLLSVGEGKADAKTNKMELAAATQLALTILNHDEAVNRR